MKHRKLSINQISESVVHMVITCVLIRIAGLGVTLQLQALNRPLAIRRNLQPYFAFAVLQQSL
jgi:hypothetical protein